MNEIVYVDVLLIVNFVVNYFLILAVGRLMNLSINKIKIILGAVFGAISSLAIFLDYKQVILLWTIRIIFPFFMIAISFPFRSLKNYVINTFTLFAVSMIFSGAMLAIWIFVPIKNMCYYNGIIYFNINPILLFVLTIVCYVILLLFKRAFNAKETTNAYYKVFIKRNGKTAVLDGFVDTGNKLKEPFTDIPVAVCYIELFKNLLSDEEYLTLTDSENMFNCPLGFRLIPYNVLKSKGILFGVMPDEVILKNENSVYIADELFIGLCDKPLGKNDFTIILPDGLFLEKKESLTKTYVNFKYGGDM